MEEVYLEQLQAEISPHLVKKTCRVRGNPSESLLLPNAILPTPACDELCLAPFAMRGVKLTELSVGAGPNLNEFKWLSPQRFLSPHCFAA